MNYGVSSMALRGEGGRRCIELSGKIIYTSKSMYTFKDTL